MNIRLKSYLILFSTFSMGLALGVLLAMATMRATIHALGGARGEDCGHPFGPPPMGPGEGGPGRMLERHLAAIVEPSQAQQEKLRPLLKKYQDKLKDGMDRHLVSVRTLMDSLDVDLGNVLTPEQMEKWKKRPRPPRMPGGPGGPMGPGPSGFRGPPGAGEFGEPPPGPPPPGNE